MVFNFLITIVFVAELIIASAIIIQLIKFDKFLLGYDAFLVKAKPEIKSISELSRKISEQLCELSTEWVKNFRATRDKIVLNQLEGLMSGILFWSINIKMLKKLRRNKLVKLAWKGLSLLGNVV